MQEQMQAAHMLQAFGLGPSEKRTCVRVGLRRTPRHLHLLLLLQGSGFTVWGWGFGVWGS